MEDKGLEAATNALTEKNRNYIYYLTHGKSESGNPLTVYEAYQKAGYESDKHAAYQLKSRLEKELMQAQIDRGASKSEIFKQIADLMVLPTIEANGSPASGLSVTNKIKVLALAVAAHKETKEEIKSITKVEINLGQPAQTAIIEDAVIIKGEENGNISGETKKD